MIAVQLLLLAAVGESVRSSEGDSEGCAVDTTGARVLTGAAVGVT